jgi:hypothetical protein
VRTLVLNVRITSTAATVVVPGVTMVLAVITVGHATHAKSA